MCIRISDDVSILRCLQYWKVWLWIHVLVSRAALICLCIIHQISCHISENLNLYIPLFLLLIIRKCYPGDLGFFFSPSLKMDTPSLYITPVAYVRWIYIYTVHRLLILNGHKCSSTKWSVQMYDREAAIYTRYSDVTCIGRTMNYIYSRPWINLHRVNCWMRWRYMNCNRDCKRKWYCNIINQ